MFKRKLALWERKLASTDVLLWREFTEPSISFLVEEKERLWYSPCDISEMGWICDWEKFSDSFVGFGDARGNPVKGDLPTFDGFCYNMPSVHITNVDKWFHVLNQVMVADHCLSLSISAFPDCLLGIGMNFWHIPILKSHLPLPGWSVSILVFYIHAGKIKRGCFRERCHQSSGGGRSAPNAIGTCIFYHSVAESWKWN